MRLVRSEDIDREVRALVDEALAVGREAEAEAVRGGKVARRLPNKPDLTEWLVTNMREAIEEELVVARPAEGEARIEPREEQREIAKRALVHIRLARLRDIAEGLGLGRGGDLEQVVDRIVRAYHDDQEAIAKLIIEHESEPPPERRFTTRLFHLSEGPKDLSAPGERAERFAHRYIRTGIARWFVVEQVAADAQKLTMHGTFRFFRADADVRNETYSLRADADSAAARLRVRAAHPFVEVDARGPTESRAIMLAFQHTTALKWRQAQSFLTGPPVDDLLAWEPRSVFLVDLLHTRFGSDALDVFDLNTAGFQTGETVPADEDETRPAVRSVKFQGRHILDSRTACELLVAGQALVELGLVLRFQATANDDVLVPLTISLERDHATVATGFGAQPPQLARQVHDLAVRGIEAAFSEVHREAQAVSRHWRARSGSEQRTKGQSSAPRCSPRHRPRGPTALPMSRRTPSRPESTP